MKTISADIKTTLRKKLFLSPTPYKREQFFKLKKVMFPCEKDFVDFLDEKDTQNSISIAKDILKRLSYEMKLSVPPYLFIDVLDLEQNKKIDTKQGYADRDHFLHLVHLYLLGLYIFFYHHALHKLISNQFTNLKRNYLKTKKRPLDEVSPIEDFILSWKLFVLGHDLGYPFQSFGIEKRYNSFVTPYKDFLKILNDDFASKILARLIGMGCVLSNHQLLNADQNLDTTRDNDFYEKIDGKLLPINETKKDLIFAKLKKAKKLPKAPGLYTIKTILSFLNSEDIIAVLEDENDITTAAIVVQLNKKDGHKAFYTSIGYSNQSLKKAELVESAFINSSQKFPKRFNWSYYCINPQENYSDQIKELKLSSTFEASIAALESESSLSLRTITTDEHFKAYGCKLYTSINSKLRRLVNEFVPDAVEAHLNIVDNEFKKLNEEIVKKISAIITGMLEKQQLLNEEEDNFDLESIDTPEAIDLLLTPFFGDIQKTEVLRRNVMNSMTKHKKEEIVFEEVKNDWDLLNKNLAVLKTNYNKLKGELSKSIDLQMESEIEKMSSIYKSWEKIYFIIQESFGDDNIFSSLPDDLDNMLSNFIENDDFKKEVYDEFIKNINYIKKDSYKTYKPFKVDNYFDHGFFSAIILFEIQRIYKLLIGKIVSEKTIRLGIGIGLPKDQNNFEYKLEKLCSLAVAAIFLHNIDPTKTDNEKDAEKRITLEANPFIFLAILADHLQEWDRPRSKNQAYADLGHETYSSKYNIVIKGDNIIISESGNKLDIKKRYNKLKTELDLKLFDASSFLKMELKEL